MKESTPPKDWRFYFKYLGLGLLAVGLIFYQLQNSRYIVGIGLLLLAISFIKRKKRGRVPERDIEQEEKEIIRHHGLVK